MFAGKKNWVSRRRLTGVKLNTGNCNYKKLLENWPKFLFKATEQVATLDKLEVRACWLDYNLQKC